MQSKNTLLCASEPAAFLEDKDVLEYEKSKVQAF